MKEVPIGQVVKVKTSLEYSEIGGTLVLIAVSLDFVTDARIVVKWLVYFGFREIQYIYT